ncbi:MAG: hypothetical protein ACRCWQ_01500, partial [Bacilli bacterium]
GRYIKLQLKGNGKNSGTRTISSLYLEPTEELKCINPLALGSDIIGGDMNNADTGLKRNGVYHYKNIKITSSLQVLNGISDHEILLGEIEMPIPKRTSTVNVEIADKKIIETNESILHKTCKLENYEEIEQMRNPNILKTINIHKVTSVDLSKYDDWDKYKEQKNEDWKNSINKIDKIITSGTIDKDYWNKINNIFSLKRKKELYISGEEDEEIIEFFKD